MAARLSLAVLFLSTLAIAVVYAAAFLPGGAPPWAAYLLAGATAAAMIASMAVGAVKEGRLGWLVIPFGAAFVLIAGGFWWILSMPPVDAASPDLWMGLPPRTAVLLYGIGLLPYFVIPVSYALTFDRRTLTEADLERVREAARAFRASRPSAGPEPAPAVVVPVVAGEGA
jgi:hypothetical protein